MQTLATQIARWQARGDLVAIATVIGTERGAPRRLGAKMAVNDSGETTDRISGDYVHSALIEIAERVIHRAEPELTTFGIAEQEARGVGLPCAEEITVWVERHSTDEFLNAAQEGRRAVEVTVLHDPDAGKKLIVKPDGSSSGTLGTPDLDSQAVHSAIELLWAEQPVRRGRLFYDVTAPPPRLILIGANHLARSLCALARAAGWRPYVIDPRSRFATAALFPDAEQVIRASPEDAFQTLGGVDPATSIVTLSEEANLNDAALLMALSSPARFIGVVSSRQGTQPRQHRLQGPGFGAEEPGRSPAAVALLDAGTGNSREAAITILAAVIAARHSQPAARLSETTDWTQEEL